MVTPGASAPPKEPESLGGGAGGRGWSRSCGQVGGVGSLAGPRRDFGFYQHLKNHGYSEFEAGGKRTISSLDGEGIERE